MNRLRRARRRRRSPSVARRAASPATASCEQIDSADLFGLDETTTSTTTTTTVAPSTATSPVEPTIGDHDDDVATEPVDLYFVDGSQLAACSIDLGRRSVAVAGGRRARWPGRRRARSASGCARCSRTTSSTPSSSPGAGFVTVDLVGEAFQRIDPADQRSAIGQIVLTLTERPGVGQVRFTLDGEPLRGARAATACRASRARRCPGRTTSRCSTSSSRRPRAVTEAPPTTTADVDAADVDAPGDLSARQYRRSTRSGRRCQSLSTFTRSARNVPSGSWRAGPLADLLEHLAAACR